MMTEAEIRRFLDNVAMTAPGDRATATELITARWLKDREEAAEEARDAIYDDAQDGYSCSVCGGCDE
jgi:hypothetical protein